MAKTSASTARLFVTKADIGLPSGFRHVSHVGWDPDRGFVVDIDDPHLKHSFVKAGVPDSQLQDRDTWQLIYDVINQSDGLEAGQGDEIVTPTTPTMPECGTGGGGASLKSPRPPQKQCSKGPTPLEIGLPFDFRHVSHVGWDHVRGFVVDIEDPHLKNFFVEVGVTDSQLQDRDTLQIICDVINQNDGLGAGLRDESLAPTTPTMSE